MILHGVLMVLPLQPDFMSLSTSSSSDDGAASASTVFYTALHRALLQGTLHVGDPLVSIVCRDKSAAEKWMQYFLSQLSCGCYKDIPYGSLETLTTTSISFRDGLKIGVITPDCTVYVGSVVCMVQSSVEYSQMQPLIQRCLCRGLPVTVCYPDSSLDSLLSSLHSLQL